MSRVWRLPIFEAWSWCENISVLGNVFKDVIELVCKTDRADLNIKNKQSILWTPKLFHHPPRYPCWLFSMTLPCATFHASKLDDHVTCAKKTKIFFMHSCIASAAKLTLDWILELVFRCFALTTVGHHAAAVHLLAPTMHHGYVGVCVILVHGSVVRTSATRGPSQG